MLLLHANQPLSTERIVDELWGEEPTANAAKSVHIYVSRLRKALGADRIETTQAGYRIHVAPGELDSERFASLAAAGKRGEALALWRGEPLADFRFEPFAQNEIRRLEALRDEVWLDELDARLADGRASQVIAELEVVIERQPLWERPRAQLMRGLYLAGRQADALALYRTTRTLLHDQLGVEPGPELQRLEQAILNHDPALGAGAGRSLIHRRRPGPVTYLVAGVGLIAVAAVAVALVMLTSGSSRALGNAVAAVDTSGHSVSYTSGGTTPGNVVVGEGGVWVLDADDRTITRIDPKTRRVVKTFATSAEPTDLAVGDGAIWVGSSEAVHGVVETGATTNLVSRVDPVSANVATSTHLPGPEAAIAAQTFGVSGIAVERTLSGPSTPTVRSRESTPRPATWSRMSKRSVRQLSRPVMRALGSSPQPRPEGPPSLASIRGRTPSAKPFPSTRRISSGLRSARVPSGRRTRSTV